MFNLIFYFYIILANPQIAANLGLPAISAVYGTSREELSRRTFSVENRYDNEFVKSVFKDNILLNLHYLAGTVTNKEDIVWAEVQKPFLYEFTLNPGEGFAYHDQILPQYKEKIVKTTNSHFNFTDGYRSSGFLYGDGVCHLASLIHWAALDADLESVSLASHDFARINEVPKEFGVSIKYMPGNFANSSRQNLYIVNQKDVPITFVFNYDGTNLTVSVMKEKVVKG